MPVNKPLFRIRAKRGFPLIAAALLASPGVMAASLQSAGQGSAGTSPRFAEPDRNDLSGTNGALGAAIQADAGKSAIYSHARMPELLSLRLMAARTEVDSSLPARDRLHQLTKINHQIVSLESEISREARAR